MITVRALAPADRAAWQESARGSGAASALIARLERIARERGAGIVRWITASDNLTAQKLYDRVATRTSWLTYDLKVE
jgi:ribosomal protein S18 acetylase RimI-like enzyme